MSTTASVQKRIITKGVRWDDIKHKDRLTEENIIDIPLSNVFAWVRDGKWKYNDFKKWWETVTFEDDSVL